MGYMLEWELSMDYYTTNYGSKWPRSVKDDNLFPEAA